MKTLLKFKSVAFIILLSAGFYSCDKDEFETSENITHEKSINSETESFKDAVEIKGEVVFSMDYDENLTEEEATAQFDTDVKRFLKNNPLTPKKALSTEWFYRTGFRTGTQTGNTSTGRVFSKIHFKTNRGTSWVAYYHPNGSASKPGWKFKMFRGFYPDNLPISHVRPVKQEIRLQGTDAWFITHLNVAMTGSWQSIKAKGSAGMSIKPYLWLKGPDRRGWNIFFSPQGKWGDKVNF